MKVALTSAYECGECGSLLKRLPTEVYNRPNRRLLEHSQGSCRHAGQVFHEPMMILQQVEDVPPGLQQAIAEVRMKQAAGECAACRTYRDTQLGEHGTTCPGCGRLVSYS